MPPTGLRTVIIGFGKIGDTYADDPVTARFYPYVTHAQVLAEHPAFDWVAVVDPSEQALERARRRWKIPCVSRSIGEEIIRCRPDVAVIATPPQYREGIIEQLPPVRAIIVEKPLGITADDAKQFVEVCRRRKCLLQVNLWRRADETFQTLAAGRLTALIGKPQAVFGVYGNGLMNNGIHQVDFVRMLLGEVAAVQAQGEATESPMSSVPCDRDVSFVLSMKSGLRVFMQTVNFQHYRENSLDIWGTGGRLAILNEGLVLQHSVRQPNRALQGAYEIASDQPSPLPSTVGRAFYRMYDNLAEGLLHGAPLWSSGESAVQSMLVIQAILESAEQGGISIPVKTTT